QWQNIEPKLTEFRSACGQTCREVEQHRKELIDLIAGPATKPEAIHAKKDQILAGQRHMQELIIQHLLSTKELLTANQQKALFDLIRSRCGCSAADCDKSSSSREGSVDCCDS